MCSNAIYYGLVQNNTFFFLRKTSFIPRSIQDQEVKQTRARTRNVSTSQRQSSQNTDQLQNKHKILCVNKSFKNKRCDRLKLGSRESFCSAVQVQSLTAWSCCFFLLTFEIQLFFGIHEDHWIFVSKPRTPSSCLPAFVS